MKRTILMRTGLFILGLLLTITIACNMNPGGDPPPKVKAAFVYHSDQAEGLLYESFLEANGYSVDLIEADDLFGASPPDLSGYELFLVGHSADNLVWDEEAKTKMITDLGKPTIGLAKGSYVFRYLGQHLQGGSAMGWSGTPNNTIRPQETSHDIWSTPNNTGVTTSDPLQVYVDDSFHTMAGLHKEGSHPIEYLATRDLDGTTHHPIAVQGSTAYWGFADDSFSEYNDTLQDILLNLLHYMLTK